MAGMFTKGGYTLVELLVVISIMAILGTFAMANFGSFKKDQDLEITVKDAHSFLRSVQSNAISGFRCSDEVNKYDPNSWKVEVSRDNIKSICEYDSNGDGIFETVKADSLDLPSNLKVKEVKAEGGGSCPNNIEEFPGTITITITATFSSVYGDISFNASADLIKDSCFASLNKITITLQSNETGQTKSVVIEKSKSVYVQ